MSILKILHFPDERLRKSAQPVENIDENIKCIIDDMFDTMYAEEGIGLAATQVNIHKQIIIIHIFEDRDYSENTESYNSPLVLINPSLLEESGTTGIEEGCLSISGIRARVTRSEKIKIMALDRNGKSFTLEANGLLSICIQHEMDHLKGKLFIDYLSSLKLQRIKKKIEKKHNLIHHK